MQHRSKDSTLRWFNHGRWNAWLLFGIAVALFANTIPNEYAMDDVVVITNNDYTQEGLKGIGKIFTEDSFTGYLGEKKELVQGGRYRPLSIATFAVEYEFFGENPHVSHAINVLLYGLLAMAIFYLFMRPGVMHYLHSWGAYDVKWEWRYLIPFVITLVYVWHPTHTEAVANIKGRDELLAMLFAVLALHSSYRYTEQPHKKWLVASGIMLFLGLLSKETAVTFIAVIPLFLGVFSSTSLRRALVATLPGLAAFVIYFALRVNFAGALDFDPPQNLMNNPFAEMGVSERYATILYTLLLYLKLLFFPHPLTVDYYPYHIPVVSFSDLRAIIPLLLYTALTVFAIVRVRKKSVVGFAILFYLITLSIASNIVFSIGTFMSERFLFMPSLGYAIFTGYLLFTFIPARISRQRYNRVSLYMGVALLILMGAFYVPKTLIRNSQWKDDFTLFAHDVKISSQSAFGNKSHGNHYIEKALDEPDSTQQRKRYLEQAQKFLRRSVKINPNYQKALFLLGNAEYLYARDFVENPNNYERSFARYAKVLNMDPDYDEIYENIAVILRGVNDPKFKLKIWRDLYKLNPDRFEVNYHLGVLSRDELKKPAQAIKFLKEAIRAKPSFTDAYLDLGVAYANAGNWEKAAQYHEQALKRGLRKKHLFRNLQIIYTQLGEPEKAARYKQMLEKAQ